jgi:hypothetical protein
MAMTKCRECSTEISTKADSCPKCGAKRKRWGIGRVLLWGIGGLVVLGWLGNLIGSHGSGSAAGSTPRDKVAMSFSSSKGGFGSILMLDITLTNKNTFAVKDIEIDCDGYGGSGTKIDHNNKTMYERLEPGETRTFKQFNMGFLNSQVSSSRCGVQSVSAI